MSDPKKVLQYVKDYTDDRPEPASRPFKAKFSDQCPVCGAFWEEGDLIQRTAEPVKVAKFSYDGERVVGHTKKSYMHANECPPTEVYKLVWEE